MKGFWLKIFTFRPILTLLTFLVGVSAVNIGFLRPIFSSKSDSDSTYWGVFKSKSSAWNCFLSFEGKDLSTLDRKAMGLLEEAVFKITDGQGGYGDIEQIAKISNEQGQDYHLLVGVGHPPVVPSASRLYFLLFDLNGNQVDSEMFDAGWRIDLSDANVRVSNEIGREIVEVSSVNVVRGTYAEKQTYALVGTSFELVRLENEKGQVVRNDYYAPNMRIGPDIKNWSSIEWKNSLFPSDPAKVLASLTWLNGVHINPGRPPYDYGRIPYEDMAEAALNDQLRSDKEIKNLIDGLLNSKNKWVREAARLSHDRNERFRIKAN